jgi:thiamine-phosphate pyrophosphorylase
MSHPRLFLVVPEALPGETLKACVEAAVKAGDCASILVPHSISAEGVAGLQSLNLAVMIKDCEPRQVHNLKADGIHISRAAPVKTLRTTFKNESIGVFAATSRHIAMEAAEAGADYIAFAQKSQSAESLADSEPLLAWWHDIFEVPTVAFDPVTADDLATLLPQNPDFVRPSDDMWKDANSATSIIMDLTRKLKT